MSNSAPPSDNSLEQKVFGVGMQRTGTTSMTRALQVLGYNSAHFPAELWNNESAPVLHRRDAFFDNPIPLLYQHLDRQCPGSKFILTIRDEDSWLDSCKFLFTEKREEYGFDESARIQEMHHALYGQNHFSEEVFREVYRSHNREVKEYFSDRPDDLLILDIAQDDKWKPICSFLGVEPPMNRSRIATPTDFWIRFSRRLEKPLEAGIEHSARSLGMRKASLMLSDCRSDARAQS